MATTTGGTLQRLAKEYRDALEAHNADAATRLERSLTQAQARVNVELTHLVKKLEAARASGEPMSPAWLYQQKRLTSLTDAITREVRAWAPYAASQIRGQALAAVEMGQTHAQALAREAARLERPGVEATFTDVDLANATQMTAHLTPGGPLRVLLERTGGEAVQAATAALVQGVALGKGSAWVTRELAKALDIPRWRSETIARTETMRAYRETSRQTYASSNVVGSWYWQAYVDRRTCVACVVMNGTEHPVTETLDGHPRCRCAMVPRTKTWAELGLDPSLDDLHPPAPLPDGKAWLTAQPEPVQVALMGPAKHHAWKTGEVTLDDMVARTHHPAWGSMRRERSLTEIRLGKNANHFASVP